MRKIENMTFDAERALYRSTGLIAVNCRFAGPADGESAFKECADITADNCYFDLRYPFWHDERAVIRNSELTPNCRAALWYSRDIEVVDTLMHGIKALRECGDVRLARCDIVSPEFGWSVTGLDMSDCRAESEYFLMRSREIKLTRVRFTGKYSFQYTENAVLEDCELNTKDAFWHARNVVVRNSVINGEYLGWYSEDLRLEHCVITGTQPLCWCKGLVLDDCEMHGCDLAFEHSEVNARVTTHIDSVKDPRSGVIYAPSAGEVIMDDENAKGKVIIK